MIYPVYVHVEAVRCLVVGAGSVACRKLAGLLESGARDILVVAPDVSGHAVSLLDRPEVRFQQRPFREDDLEGCLLVFAATNSREINAGIAALCRQRTILCSVADDAAQGSFITPARLERGGLHVALASDGLSPALVARVKKELDAWLGHRYDSQFALLAALRPLIVESDAFSTQAERGSLLRCLAGPELGDALNQRNKDLCLALLHKALPASLHARCAEILHELV